LQLKAKKVLVTTPIIETWGESHEEILLLGEWCKTLENETILETREHSTLKYHGDDTTQRPIRHKYLFNLHEKVLLSLRDTLNNYHNVNHSLRYWRILIGPWLLTYISIIWDRWESLNTAFQEYSCSKTIFLNLEKKKMVPADFESFNRIRSTDIWNHHLYSEIINYKYAHKLKTIPLDHNYNCELNEKQNNKQTMKGKIAYIVDQFLSSIQSNYKVVFFHPYFDIKALFSISRRLHQLPRQHYEFLKKIEFPTTEEERYEQTVSLDSTNDFEKYLASQILSQIPISYFEGYQELNKCAQTIKTKGSILFTANAHLCNDLFNCFAANHVENGGKLIVSQHGGSFKTPIILFHHQEKIADIMTVWHKPYMDNHVKLPPNKLINLRHKKPQTNKSKYLLLLGFETSSYNYRIGAPIGGMNYKKDYNHKIECARHLSPAVFKYLRVRTGNYGKGHTNSRDHYARDLGMDKISSYTSAPEAFSTAKIILNTYPMTTFSEGLSSGVPTILLYCEEYWGPHHPQFDNVKMEMKNSKIIFTDPRKAAEHINNIWHDPYVWWSSPEVTEAREHFHDLCGRVNKDWANKWVEFFNKQLEGK